MLICVFVYHHGCPGDTGLAAVWQPQCLLKKGKINGVHANRPFSQVYVSAGQMSTNSETICLPGFSAWGPCCSTWTHLDPVLPLPAVSQWTQRDPHGTAAMSVPLTEPCLCVWPVNPWVTEKWCELWLLSGCSARESIHCLALCTDCQSVSWSICHSKSEQNKLK